MEKTLKKLLMAGTISLALLNGCEKKVITRIEQSELLQENGKVIDTLYNKGYHESSLDLQPRYDIVNGSFNMAVTTKKINDPETWGIVFRCDHGNKFAIQGSQPEYKSLWEKLDDGIDVLIDYKQIRKNTYEDINGDGIKDLTLSEIIDYDFVDANPILKKE